jgi:hypothetical protein
MVAVACTGLLFVFDTLFRVSNSVFASAAIFFDGTRRSSPFALIEREKLYKGIARERITEKRGTKI